MQDLAAVTHRQGPLYPTQLIPASASSRMTRILRFSADITRAQKSLPVQGAHESSVLSSIKSNTPVVLGSYCSEISKGEDISIFLMALTDPLTGTH
jgi:hypothetical protein